MFSINRNRKESAGTLSDPKHQRTVRSSVMPKTIYTENLDQLFDLPPSNIDLSDIEYGDPVGSSWNKGMKNWRPDYTHSEETKQKISESNKGNIPTNLQTLNSEKNISKRAKTHTGKIHNMDKTTKLYAKGRERTPAQIAAAKAHSERMKGRVPWNKK